MTNQDRKTLAEALFAVAVENQSQKESRLATLEAENAKLRDLLRRVYACAANGSSAVDTTVRLALLLPEISKAIEPSGDAGELKP